MVDEEDSEFKRCINSILSKSTKQDNFLKCINLLGIKTDQFNIIHVSGTNGKSSVAFKVSKCLISLGLKVGLFTSPHIFEYTERVRVQCVQIPKRDFVRITDYIFSVVGDMPIHFFSTILLISLVYFTEKKVEWVVLESGIGGLLDPTNFAPNTKAVVISSIGYDHMEILGKTLDEIALQKAGTIKRGSVVVLGPNCHKDEIFENKAREVGARVIKNNKKDFESFDEENTETSRLVVEEALGLGVANISALSSRLKMRMKILSKQECEAVKNHVLSKYPSLVPKLNEFGIPKAVVLDIAHNNTAINRLCSDLFKVYGGNAVFCVAISLNRTLSIFNPLVSFLNKDSRRSIEIFYLDVNHSYCRTLKDVDSDLDKVDLHPDAKKILKSGLDKTRLICSTESSGFNYSNEVLGI
ncbi:dihydrofolate synthase/folylpolyglutamate synthase, putative [Theileria annulata]|uniref:Dihydrofolate synthase/folylpolyglutamate synthase, putative n=1 Tax=Theileria annulata TaxID=5874 RepID=Q4UH02_THEAN|nr:dihydrofolate synthase/folylpolyglutamate synthase, putative [Theileria annulata]CAI73637.1 dihydrofolate synthase/folylpolyglutamate synthase, putative [Theileria annulata]|eukprot:XP_954314.1 dihydrofolate synthase/folylpolyglutamate synthase, putative [Theileria annulata]